jgi:CrcB protein
MHNYLLVFLGGGLGSICRFGIGHCLASSRLAFPWATLLANVFACFILGCLVGLNLKGRLEASAAVFLMGGFCGGFSTFSTFTNETFQMMAAGEWAKVAANVFGSLLFCLLALYAGIKTTG